MTGTTWALAGLLAFSAGLCVWAALTGRPDSAPSPQHARWGDGRTDLLLEPDREPGDTRPLRAPTKRWYDENPWQHGSDLPPWV